jgi:NAD+ diphosphatase
MAPDNLFAGAYLDRRAEARLRADWLAEARGDADTIYIAMSQGAALVRPAPEGELSRVAFLAGSDPRVAATTDSEQLVLLGWYQQRRCLLVDLPADLATAAEGEQFAELRPLVSELPAAEASLLAYARALNLWRANHLFCSRCGTPTRAERAGHARHCPACGYHSFPRLDPAIIVLAQSGEQALLGRQPSWPVGRYSTIAGFVEPGESLEDAVRRELYEETGVVAGEIIYHSSQPWPFPSSLMVGFMAEAVVTTPVLHDGELEDARWFTREEIRSGSVLLPPPTAIARRLIDRWLHHAQ